MKALRWYFVFAATAAIAAGPAIAATYTTIDYPGAIYTTVNGGPSPQGDVVGTYIDAAHKTHGFLRTAKGTFTSIDYPGAINTQINGWVNPSGSIVGQYVDTANKTHGFMLTAKGVFTSIDYPGGTSTVLSGINPEGQVIGNYCVPGHCGAFTMSDGVFTPLTYPNTNIYSGSTISPTGATVSACVAEGKYQLCLIDQSGALTTVFYPGSSWTASGAGNPENDVVGGFIDAHGTHGFLFSGGVYTQLDVPGATSTFATGISPQKFVVGQYYDKAGKSHGFIVRP